MYSEEGRPQPLTESWYVYKPLQGLCVCLCVGVGVHVYTCACTEDLGWLGPCIYDIYFALPRAPMYHLLGPTEELDTNPWEGDSLGHPELSSPYMKL